MINAIKNAATAVLEFIAKGIYRAMKFSDTLFNAVSLKKAAGLKPTVLDYLKVPAGIIVGLLFLSILVTPIYILSGYMVALLAPIMGEMMAYIVTLVARITLLNVIFDEVLRMQRKAAVQEMVKAQADRAAAAKRHADEARAEADQLMGSAAAAV